MDWKALGAAIAKAFGFDAREASLEVPKTCQIGVYSRSGFRVLLTSQNSGQSFRGAVAELVARQNEPFVLFAPTSRFMDSQTRDLMNLRGAGFFDLSTYAVIESGGKLVARKPAGELFAPFSVSKLEEEGLHKMLDGFRDDIASLLEERRDLQAAKDHLADLLRMKGAGMFDFAKIIDPDDFRIFLAVLAKGDVANASNALRRPNSTIRSIMKLWPGKGPSYARMLDTIRWCKAEKRRPDTVPYDDHYLNLPLENQTEYPELLAEILGEVMSMTENNWSEICQELQSMLKKHIPT
jgi:hypothetical protein